MQETQETRVPFLGQEDPLEKEIAIHSSILAWTTPWTEEPGGLQSTGSQRVGHDWATEHALRDPAQVAWARNRLESGTRAVKEKQGKTCVSGRTQEDGDVCLRVKAYDTEMDLVKWKPFQNQRTPTVAGPTLQAKQGMVKEKLRLFGLKKRKFSPREAGDAFKTFKCHTKA